LRVLFFSFLDLKQRVSWIIKTSKEDISPFIAILDDPYQVFPITVSLLDLTLGFNDEATTLDCFHVDGSQMWSSIVVEFQIPTLRDAIAITNILLLGATGMDENRVVFAFIFTILVLLVHSEETEAFGWCGSHILPFHHAVIVPWIIVPVFWIRTENHSFFLHPKITRDPGFGSVDIGNVLEAINEVSFDDGMDNWNQILDSIVLLSFHALDNSIGLIPDEIKGMMNREDVLPCRFRDVFGLISAVCLLESLDFIENGFLLHSMSHLGVESLLSSHLDGDNVFLDPVLESSFANTSIEVQGRPVIFNILGNMEKFMEFLEIP